MVKQGDIIWLDFDPQTGHEQRGRLCDQPRTLDIFARNYKMIERLPDTLLFEVIDVIGGFIEPE